MFEFPRKLPKIEIIELSKTGSVVCNQVLGWVMEPKPGEKASYAEYEAMEGRGLLVVNEGFVSNHARIHGIDCYEMVSSYANFNDKKKHTVITFNRIIDDHIQSLAYIEEYPGGRRDFYTFKDEHFMEHWAEGDDNSGMEIQLVNKGLITADDDKIIAPDGKNGMYDVVGEYQINIGGEAIPSVRLVFISSDSQVSDFFIGKNGKEIFHRLFIPDDGFDGSLKESSYSKKYPNAYTLMVNDRKCICTSYVIPDYVLRV
jgi:hypothetical protein